MRYTLLWLSLIAELGLCVPISFIPTQSVSQTEVNTYNEHQHTSQDHRFDHPKPDTETDMLTFAVIMIVGFGVVVLSIVSAITFVTIKYLIKRKRSVRLSNTIPGSIDDEFEIEERISELSPNEQNLYRAGQDYIKQFPPLNDEISLSNHLIIQERGIEAWEFIPDSSLADNAIDVINKTEITYNSFDYQCSIQSNLPIPKINDVYYYEAKIFNLDSPDDTTISIGLSTKPYPSFRLPGRHLYSVAYDSNGSRRVNNSFKLNEAESTVFPRLIKGDVVGIGYRVRSGTIFFTRNGKKLSEKSIGGHIKGMKMNNIFPTIGANNPCTLHINFGQYGYVFIEANIKKWGYALKEGTRPPLPDYNFSSNDLLLESSNEDDEEIIDPPDFYSSAGYHSANTSSSSLLNDDITLSTLPGELPQEPPIYDEELEAQYDDGDEYDEHDGDNSEVTRNTLLNQFAVDLDADENDGNETGNENENA